MAVDPAIVRAVKRLKDKNTSRDAVMLQSKLVRDGKLHLLFPDNFSDEWPKSVVANFIDVAARDLSEAIAPLPSLSAASGDMSTDKARRFAAKKTKVGQYYWQRSRLARQMISGVDRYLTYGFLPFIIEPDYDLKTPVIRVDDPMGSYYENDRWGCTLVYVKTWKQRASDLAALFPEHEDQIFKDERFGTRGAGDPELEVIRFSDTDHEVLYIPSKGIDKAGLVLETVPNLVSRCPVSVAVRRGLTDGRGQFEDTIWVQLARAKMALIKLQAAEKSVEAPIAVPDDLTDLPIGPDAVWRTREPQSIRRISLDVSPTVFAEDQALNQELHMGARYNEARGGNVDASVITGRGIQAMMGGFDTQIKTAQTEIGEALREATMIAYEMDEKVWGKVEKTVRGTSKGTPYEIKYKPVNDIAGDYTCDVTYGFAAGLNANQSLVLLLQLRGDKAISRELMMKQMPFDMNVEEQQRIIDTEETRDALKQAIFQTAGAIPQLVLQGQDPTVIINAIAQFTAMREKGMSAEDAALKAFTPPAQPGEEGAADQASEPGGEPSSEGGGDMGNFGGNPWQGSMATQHNELGPGGRPDLQTLIAGLRGGRAELNASVQRRLPA